MRIWRFIGIADYINMKINHDGFFTLETSIFGKNSEDNSDYAECLAVISLIIDDTHVLSREIELKFEIVHQVWEAVNNERVNHLIDIAIEKLKKEAISFVNNTF